MNQHRKLRICIGASAGGHLTELLRLSESWEGYTTCCVSTLPIVKNTLARWGRVYIIGECNRHHPLRAVKTILHCVGVIIRERPDVVLTTGSLPLAILCCVAKLAGAKVIWIDSITNLTDLSLSGRLVRPFADLMFTQWPCVKERYPGTEYVEAML